MLYYTRAHTDNVIPKMNWEIENLFEHGGKSTKLKDLNSSPHLHVPPMSTTVSLGEALSNWGWRLKDMLSMSCIYN